MGGQVLLTYMAMDRLGGTIMAAKTTVRVSLVNNAAKDDSFTDANYSWLSDSEGTGGVEGDLNVLGNDPGSAQLIGVSDGIPTQPELTQLADTITNDINGAELDRPIEIQVNSDGTIHFDASALGDTLGEGEETIVTFYYTAKMANGAYSTAKVTITLNGVNDAPELSVRSKS